LTTVLVIGARGMLGREICRAAGARGFDVVRTGREPAPGWITFDAERDDPGRLFQQEVTLAVNCAAILAADLKLDDAAMLASAERVNARFPHELADTAPAAGARVVHISTDGV